MNACDDIMLLNILRIFKNLLDVVTFVVPVILLIFVMIEVIKTVSSGPVDTKKLFNSIGKRLIAAVVIFLLMPIINLILSLFGDKLYYVDCWNNANKTYIESIATKKADEALDYANLICDENHNESEKKKAYEEARVAIKNIPFKDTREGYKSKLDKLKPLCKN